MNELLSFLETDNFWNNFFEHSPYSMWISDSNGVMVKINNSFKKMWNLNENEVIGVYNLFTDNILKEKEIAEKVNFVFQKKQTVNFKLVKYNPKQIDNINFTNGIERIIEVTVTPILNNDGRLIGAVIQHFDLTDRENYANKINKNKYWLQKAQEVAHIGHWVWEIENNKLFWSDEVYRIFGVNPDYFDPSLATLEAAIHPDDSEDFSKYKAQLLNSRKNKILEYRIIRPSAEVRYIILDSEIILDDAGKLETVIGTIQDITEYKNLYLQLINSEKLSAVGLLASGIAHEFNNILAINSAYAQLLEITEKDNLSEESLDLLHNIDIAIKRGAVIVSNIMDFANPNEPKKELLKIENVIEKVLNLQEQHLILEHIEIERNYESPEKVFVDYGQFQQVFLNLIINARHAMLHKGRGKISICLKTIDKIVQIKISDEGIGIDKENLMNIFNPFYSTKGAYAGNNMGIKGTGLGLAVSYTIIKNHNGTIRVESEKNKGTTFIIELPVADKEETHLTENINGDGLNNKSISGITLDILIIDDEKPLLNAVTKLFRANNCNVSGTTFGMEGIRIARKNKFDIIFMDILLPDISGEIILKEIRKFDSNTPVVFMSGQVGLEIDKLLNSGVFAFIQKPFDMQKIESILNEIRRKKNNNIL